MSQLLSNWGRVLKINKKNDPFFFFWSQIFADKNICEYTWRIFFIYFERKEGNNIKQQPRGYITQQPAALKNKMEERTGSNNGTLSINEYVDNIKIKNGIDGSANTEYHRFQKKIDPERIFS